MPKIIKELEAVFQMLSKYSPQIKVYIKRNKLIKQLENEPPESVVNNILTKFKNIINKQAKKKLENY